MGRKPKEKKKYGKDYGVPVAFRMKTEDYNYLIEIGKRRLEEKSKIFRAAISHYVEHLKSIEKKYNDWNIL